MSDVYIGRTLLILTLTFFPSAVKLWNTLPVEVCQLPADCFKSRLYSIHFS